MARPEEAKQFQKVGVILVTKCHKVFKQNKTVDVESSHFLHNAANWRKPELQCHFFVQKVFQSECEWACEDFCCKLIGNFIQWGFTGFSRQQNGDQIVRILIFLPLYAQRPVLFQGERAFFDIHLIFVNHSFLFFARKSVRFE